MAAQSRSTSSRAFQVIDEWRYFILCFKYCFLLGGMKSVDCVTLFGTFANTTLDGTRVIVVGVWGSYREARRGDEQQLHGRLVLLSNVLFTVFNQ